MQNDSNIFLATEPVDVSKRKRFPMIYLSGFAAAVLLVILAIMDGNNFKTFIFSIFLISNGIGLFFPDNIKPLKLEINYTGFTLYNAGSNKHLDWREVKMARYNGRYLDVIWGSSFRESIDLQKFSSNERVEIIRLLEMYLAQQNVFITKKNDIGESVA